MTTIDRKDVLMFLGAACLVAGTWQVYRPAALILLGVLFIFWAVMDARAAALSKNGGE